MKRLAFFSGGKDATLAIVECTTAKRPIDGLVTTFSESTGRLAIQGLRLSIIQAQADRMNLPLLAIGLPDDCPNDIYIQRLESKLGSLSGLDSLVFGDIHLEDIRQFREQQFSKMGIKLEFPLWGSSSENIAAQILDAGIEATICTIAPDRGDAEWLGAPYSESWLDALPGSIDPCGEFGEFHSVVTDAPVFSRPLRLAPGRVFSQSEQSSLDFRVV